VVLDVSANLVVTAAGWFMRLSVHHRLHRRCRRMLQRWISITLIVTVLNTIRTAAAATQPNEAVNSQINAHPQYDQRSDLVQ